MIPLHDDNPTERRPVVTLSLIAAGVAAFLWQLTLGPPHAEAVIRALGLVPATLTGVAAPGPVPPLLTVLSSMFLHGGWMHLAGNMLYLWIFGNNVEDAMGHGRFLAFYLLCGAIAALAQIVSDPGSTLPMIGASGAISGVLGAYLLLYSHARVLVLVPLGLLTRVIRLPALFVLGFWIVFQLLSAALASPEGGGIAWLAHIGGFVAGMVLVFPFKRRGVTLFHPRRY